MNERAGQHHRNESEYAVIPTIPITQDEYEELCTLGEERRKPKSPWALTFSVGSQGEIFRHQGSGKTSQEDREDIRGASEVLSKIADQAVHRRGAFGRFFVNETGVFYKDRDRSVGLRQCVRFSLQNPPVQR